MKLFQITRCIKWRIHELSPYDEEQNSLKSRAASLENIMRNYRELPPSQIILACIETSKLSSIFKNV